jgi:hypothetical protein
MTLGSRDRSPGESPVETAVSRWDLPPGEVRRR